MPWGNARSCQEGTGCSEIVSWRTTPFFVVVGHPCVLYCGRWCCQSSLRLSRAAMDYKLHVWVDLLCFFTLFAGSLLHAMGMGGWPCCVRIACGPLVPWVGPSVLGPWPWVSLWLPGARPVLAPGPWPGPWSWPFVSAGASFMVWRRVCLCACCV